MRKQPYLFSTQAQEEAQNLATFCCDAFPREYSRITITPSNILARDREKLFRRAQNYAKIIKNRSCTHGKATCNLIACHAWTELLVLHFFIFFEVLWSSFYCRTSESIYYMLSWLIIPSLLNNASEITTAIKVTYKVSILSLQRLWFLLHHIVSKLQGLLFILKNLCESEKIAKMGMWHIQSRCFNSVKRATKQAVAAYTMLARSFAIQRKPMSKHHNGKPWFRMPMKVLL